MKFLAPALFLILAGCIGKQPVAAVTQALKAAPVVIETPNAKPAPIAKPVKKRWYQNRWIVPR